MELLVAGSSYINYCNFQYFCSIFTRRYTTVKENLIVSSWEAISIVSAFTALRVRLDLHLHGLHDTRMVVRYVMHYRRRSSVIRHVHDSLRTCIALAVIGDRPRPRRPSSCIASVFVQNVRLQVTAALLSKPTACRAGSILTR